MTAIVVKPTQEEWQASRPDHINASEMGVITGVSKYGSIVDLYNKKVNRELERRRFLLLPLFFSSSFVGEGPVPNSAGISFKGMDFSMVFSILLK